MRSGFNPARRNRNIGTPKQGHGSNNKFVIPSICRAERIWWEQLTDYVVVDRLVAGRKIQFIIETTQNSYAHSCTADDVCYMLEHIPSQDWTGIEAFLFRQPTRKQGIMNPAWGRLAYASDVGRPGNPNIYSGPLVIIEACKPQAPWTSSHSLSPAYALELDRLREDGHDVRDDGRRYVITSSVEAIRATQLYRTLPHEIGHWLDHLQSVEWPSKDNFDRYAELSDLYFARPSSEREAFAHRYADECRSRLLKDGVIPFAPIPNATS